MITRWLKKTSTPYASVRFSVAGKGEKIVMARLNSSRYEQFQTVAAVLICLYRCPTVLHEARGNWREVLRDYFVLVFSWRTKVRNRFENDPRPSPAMNDRILGISTHTRSGCPVLAWSTVSSI